LSVLSPDARRDEQRRAFFTHRRDRFFEAGGERLSGELVQERFGIDQIEMTRAPFEETPDHSFGSWPEVRLRTVRSRGEAFVLHHGGQRQGTESGTGSLEEFAPRLRSLMMRKIE
jgi:hypothetical protein